MRNNLTTVRLELNPLELSDSPFIFDLLNTENWIKFIGNRNINSDEDAINYIQKIKDNPDADYKVVRLKDALVSIGVITFIKRHYLDHWDIGFAFLPEYAKKGYAFEATQAVLADIKEDKTHEFILATTLKDNINSINLLEKLGLKYTKDILIGDDNLMLFLMDNG
jgi:[ribosomal protein S5]-alanine N-acetyltransferase